MLVEKTFNFFLSRFKIIKENQYFNLPHARLGNDLHIFAQHMEC
jgi:hypothetical protein